MARPFAYITAAWSSDEYDAKNAALKYARQIYDAGFTPICPKIFYGGFLKDDIPKEHKDRLDMSAELLRRSRIVVVCGSGTDEQVKNDIALAKRLHIAATTLDGILTVEGAGKRKEP